MLNYRFAFNKTQALPKNLVQDEYHEYLSEI